MTILNSWIREKVFIKIGANMNWIKERQEIVEYGIKMNEEGLSSGTSGNLSIYIPKDNVVLITPSGIDYLKMEIEDIVAIDLDGIVLEGERKPSSEWQLHTLCYKNKPQIHGVVHTHSIYCTVFSTLRMPIEAVHYAIADVNSNCNKILCTDYYRYGTKELAEAAVNTMGESYAVLLANHGLVTCGSSLNSAFSLAREAEYVAKIQHLAMSIGKPHILTYEEMEEVKNGFKSYGQK